MKIEPIDDSQLSLIQQRGWLRVSDSSPQHAKEALSLLGRLDTSSISILEPKTQSKAAPWSLSGEYGLGEFPWHTDGAISRRPPRYIALLALACTPNSAQTQLLDPHAESSTHLEKSVTAALRSTVLRGRDSTGRTRIFRALEKLDGKELIRWDPRIFDPATHELESASKLIEESLPTTAICWKPGTLAIIDNWRLLHKRTAVEPSESRQLWRAYAF